MNKSTSFKQARQHRRIWLFIFVGWIILLTLLSLCRNPGIKSQNWFSQYHIDKLGHFIFYAVMFYLFAKAFLEKRFRFIVFIAGIVFCILYGVLIEYLQSMVTSGRQRDVLDMIANSAGVLVVAFFYYKKKKHDVEYIKQ